LTPFLHIPQKLAKGSLPSESDSLAVSAKKGQQDFSQTEGDFSKLESQVEPKK
jgi:hypothetical protein